MQKPIGIIGAGNMGEALITGITQAGLLSPREIFFSEPRRDRSEYLQSRFGIRYAKTNRDLVAQVPTLVLAVKPPVVREVFIEIASFLKPRHLIISICAGVSIDYLQSLCPAPIRIIRAMPNTPAIVQKGATALALSPQAKAEDLLTAEAIFQAVGITVTVKEAQMDAITGLSGSGPAYIFALIEALVAGGVKEGLAPDVALTLATQTTLGAAHLIQASAKHPGILREQVCTPGGTTIAGLYALEKEGFRLALMNAVIAATKRSKELGETLQKTPITPRPQKKNGHRPPTKR